jgi:UrcA family protein
MIVSSSSRLPPFSAITLDDEAPPRRNSNTTQSKGFVMIKFALTALTATTLTTAPALAKDGSWQVGNDQIHIVYSDIDTGTIAGRAVLLARVERAAGKLCDSVLGSDRRDCVRSVLAAAATAPKGRPLTLAMIERGGSVLAAR